MPENIKSYSASELYERAKEMAKELAGLPYDQAIYLVEQLKHQIQLNSKVEFSRTC